MLDHTPGIGRVILTKSREQWKLKAEQTNNQLTVLEAENASLRARSQRWQKKKTIRPSQG